MKRYAILLALLLAVGCRRDNTFDDTTLTESSISVTMVRVTDSTVTIEWQDVVDSEDVVSNYRVALYNSQQCDRASLETSIESVPGALFEGNSQPQRFVFTDLKPDTDYYVKVFNLTRSSQNGEPLRVTTVAACEDSTTIAVKDAAAGELIAYQSFSSLIYGGDCVCSAIGLYPTDLPTLKSLRRLKSKISLVEQSGIALATSENGLTLFGDMRGVVDDMGLERWGYTTASVYAHAGYVEVGAGSALCTPAITSIPEDKQAKVRVVFRAAACDEAGLATSLKATVNVLSGAALQSNSSVSYVAVASSAAVVVESSDSTAWREYSVTLDKLLYGASVSIGCDAERLMIDDVRLYVDALEGAEPIGGRITDSDSKPVEGVVVTDGYSVTKSDEEGYYTLPYNANAEFIYYTTPAEYQVAVADDGYPLFYKSAKSADLDFVLSERIGKQSKWYLYVMADPQTNQTGKLCIPYFSNYMAADIYNTVVTEGYNSGANWQGSALAYGVVLGDIIWNSATTSYMGAMKEAMSPANTRVSWFTVPGNHDWYSTDSDTNPSLDCYHSLFGPSRYSFDRGEVHIVCLNNTITRAGVAVEDYNEGFTAAEFAWLKADLECVPKEKCVVLCVHIPFFDGEVGVRHSAYYTETLELLKEYRNAYIFSGHNHYARHWFHSKYGNVHEMNHGAACGLYWNLKLCGDGTPAGYYIYTFENDDCTDMIFKAAGTESIDDGANALRMYLGSDSYDRKMVSSYGKSDKAVYINLYNGHTLSSADSSPLNRPWSVELYYQGAKVMDMVTVKSSDATYGYHNKPSDYISNYSTWLYNDDYLRNDADWWLIAQGLPANSAIKNRNGNSWGGALSNSGYKKTTTHIFAGLLPETVTLDSRDVMVRATTPSGRVYEVTEFTQFSSIDGLAWELR